MLNVGTLCVDCFVLLLLYFIFPEFLDGLIIDCIEELVLQS